MRTAQGLRRRSSDDCAHSRSTPVPERRLDDDDTWEVHRGRLTPSTSYELRQRRDPLVVRVLQLRAEQAALERSQRLEGQTPAARRQKRAQRAAERREAALTASQRAALAQHQADLQRMRERLASAETVQ
jgi:hypothetical protein